MRLLIFSVIFFICRILPCYADDISSVRSQLYEITQSIRIAESQSGKIQTEIDRLDAEKQELITHLKKSQYDVARYLSALHRLETSSDRLAFLLPDSSYLDYYYRVRTYKTRKDILSARIFDNYLILTSIEDKQAAIKNYLNQKQDLSMAVQALIDKIETINEDRNDIYEQVKILQATDLSLNQFISSIIDIPYIPHITDKLLFSSPVSGVITVNNNELHIETAYNAIITSPANGMIAYADNFGNLGNIVIINHGHGYVSILRPFERLLVKQGMIIAAGEPLGIVKSNNNWEKDGNTPMLYYGLRYNERPINPLTKFSGL
jgi:uncharacterized protein (UPF0335 family)